MLVSTYEYSLLHLNYSLIHDFFMLSLTHHFHWAGRYWYKYDSRKSVWYYCFRHCFSSLSWTIVKHIILSISPHESDYNYPGSVNQLLDVMIENPGIINNSKILFAASENPDNACNEQIYQLLSLSLQLIYFSVVICDKSRYCSVINWDKSR